MIALAEGDMLEVDEQAGERSLRHYIGTDEG